MHQGYNDNPLLDPRVIEIRDRLLSRLDGTLDSDEKRSWTIDPVPSNLRVVHNNAFDPQMITIGPVKNPGIYDRVQVMEEYKERFLNRLLGRKLECRTRIGGDMSRTTEGERPSNDRKREEDDDGGQMAKAVLDDLVNAMADLRPEMRACYPEKTEHDRLDFYFFDSRIEEMMVIDCCFVVELLRLYYHYLHTESTGGVEIVDDPIFANPQILATLRRDLLLLENQLPFFVLKKIYQLIIEMKGIRHEAKPLEELAVTFFDPLLPQSDVVSKVRGKKPEALHLLDLFHFTFLQSVSDKVQKGNSRVNPSLKSNGGIAGLVSYFASDLQEAGVKFKKRKDHDLLDIEFDHRTLRVPPLFINDHTISLLLNFVAFELSVNHPKPYFANYLMFWNSLINSAGDVRILHKHGIINHLKSDEDVFKLLIKCREVIFDRGLGYLYDEIKEVNDYCERYSESKSLVWWISLIRERFSSPWTCLSLFAAIILLLLTLLQTFYTVYPYYRPH